MFGVGLFSEYISVIFGVVLWVEVVLHSQDELIEVRFIFFFFFWCGLFRQQFVNKIIHLFPYKSSQNCFLSFLIFYVVCSEIIFQSVDIFCPLSTLFSDSQSNSG